MSIEFDWEGYRDKYGNIQRLDRVLEAEGNSTNRYKASASRRTDVVVFAVAARAPRSARSSWL